MTWKIVISGLLAFCLTGLVVNGEPKSDPDLKWARGIADDFWKAALSDNGEQAAGLLSPELFKILSHDGWAPSSVGAGEGVKMLVGQYVNAGASLTFNQEEVAPDRSEVIFRGSLSAKNDTGEKVAANFKMRIAREGVGGKWSIRYLLITDQKSPLQEK